MNTSTSDGPVYRCDCGRTFTLDAYGFRYRCVCGRGWTQYRGGTVSSDRLRSPIGTRSVVLTMPKGAA